MLKPLAAALLLIATPATAAEEQLVPTWMTVDAGAHKVTMDVVAGFNPNNSNWNFNGYYEGNMTVVVPEGWRVAIGFSNRDANFPHSLVVIADPGSEDDLPAQAGREDVAISRAYSKSPIEGIFSNEQDTVAFTAAPAGDYLLYCGVPAHGLSGMWVNLTISAETEEPYVTIAEDAEAGRT
jgi:sulfocyanin